MKVEQIDHLGIYVKDLDKGAQFFRDVFGFEFSREFGAEGMDVREVVDTRGLDLLAAKTSDGPMARIIEHRGEGLASLSLKVPSLEEGIEEMKSRDIRLIHRGDHGDAAKWATFHPKDLFGVFVELVEYNPENLYLSAARKPPAVLYPKGEEPPKVKVEGIDHVGNLREGPGPGSSGLGGSVQSEILPDLWSGRRGCPAGDGFSGDQSDGTQNH